VADKRRILIIDDSEIVLQRLRTRLTAEGYEVVTTRQPVGAGKHLLRCDLVIIDFYMPGIDGGEVVRSLRSACATLGARPAFYVYTSDHTIEKDASKWGFDGSFVHKGDDDALVHQVAASFRLAQLRGFGRKPQN
jgi:two-component system, OmpR family, response regulator